MRLRVSPMRCSTVAATSSRFCTAYSTDRMVPSAVVLTFARWRARALQHDVRAAHEIVRDKNLKARELSGQPVRVGGLHPFRHAQQQFTRDATVANVLAFHHHDEFVAVRVLPGGNVPAHSSKRFSRRGTSSVRWRTRVRSRNCVS